MTTITRPDWAQNDTDLTGRTFLVLGGTGGVGDGVVTSALQLGGTETFPEPTHSRLRELRATWDPHRLFTPNFDVSA